MKKSTFIFLFFYLLHIPQFIAQNSDKSYLILTFEKINKKALHAGENFYWIIPVDSLESKSKIFSPVYFANYSKSAFNDCVNKKTINLFIPTNDQEWNFTKQYLDLQKNIADIVKNKRKKILVNKMQWEDGLEEIINVYVTPIKGNLCNCQIDKDNEKLIDYYDMIYLPVENIQYDNSFWKIHNIHFSSLLDNFPFNKIKNADFR